MIALSSQRLLTTWEHGAQRHPIDRALLLLSLARPDLASGQLADVPLGARNVALMGLSRDCFGERLDAWLDCPSCGERMEFELNAEQFPPMLADVDEPIHIAGHNFRRPTSRHLASLVVGAENPNAVAQHLLRDCAESPADLPQDEQALLDLLDMVGAAMEAADPWADIALAIDCPACDSECKASFDIASFLWDKLDCRAHQLLDDVHLLAQAYGWTEPDILALGNMRRATYLSRLQT